MKKAKDVASKILLILLALVLTSPFYAQDTYLPVPSQYQLILKVLTFDKDLEDRDEVVMGILYDKAYSPSVSVKDGLVKIMNEFSPQYIEGIPLRHVVIELQSRSALASAIAKNEINMLYITPITKDDLRSVLKVCNEKKIPTFTGIPSFVELGVAVGFRKKSQGVDIFINLTAVNEQGFNLSSRLLHLAKISGKLTEKEENP